MKIKSFLLVLIVCFSFQNIISAKTYKGAELRTKAAYLYGRFEVRYKAIQKDGILASFFTYYDGGSGTSTWNELDIEVMGRYENDVQFNSITPGQVNHVRHQNLNFNPSVDFHDYAIEWTPSYVAWFVDGEMVHKQTGAHIATINKAQKIMMNVWNPTAEGWAGVWDAAVLPAFAYYDYVKYYSYTPGTGNYGTDNNFTQIWVDDFNAFDGNRWAKATHTFDGNNCDFIPENIVYKDGYMILCLTDGNNLGYQDNVAPSPMNARYEYNNVYVRFNEDLDPISSCELSNYILNATINNISLLSDKKTVKINVSGFNSTVTNNLILRNIKDASENGNMLSAKAITIANSNPISFPASINIGGNVYNHFLADQEFKYNNEYGYSEGTAAFTSSTQQISGTDDDPVYRAERYYLTKYDVRVPNGRYNVKLQFCENYFSAVGSRVFDIYVQNNKVKEDLDIYKEVGIHAAYDLPLSNIIVENGKISVHLCAEVSETIINGIVIEQIETGVNDNETNLDYSFQLMQNYPNPFNGTTKIPINLNNSESVRLNIYNILGQLKYSKIYDNLSQGSTELVWNGTGEHGETLCSGVYVYEVQNGRKSASKKMIYLK